MDVLIIEDEKPAADKLIRLLGKTSEDIIILDNLETVEESINWFLDNPSPDLIFMDIQLDDGICFEIFESVKINTPVIFTTAYDEFAIRAFKVNSIDYLLKPIDLDSLVKALEKFRSLYPPQKVDTGKIDRLYEQLVKKYKTRFFVKVGEYCRSIMTSDLKYIYIDERSTFIKTLSGRIYDIDYSLERIQKMLDPDIFYRINRKYIININSIVDVIRYSANRLKVRLQNEEDNIDLIVSRDKVGDFKKWLDR